MSHVYVGRHYCARVRAFEQLYLSNLASEVIYENSFTLKPSVSNREYTPINILRSNHKVVNPSLPQNVDMNN